MPVKSVTLRVIFCDCCGSVGPCSEDYQHAMREAFSVGWDMVGFGGPEDCWWCPRCSEEGRMPDLDRARDAIQIAHEEDGYHVREAGNG